MKRVTLTSKQAWSILLVVLTAGISFGIWNDNFWAGLFAFMFIGALYDIVIQIGSLNE